MNEKTRQYQLWFLITLSAFLIVTFGLYLPLRFQHQGERHEAGLATAVYGQAGTVYHEEIEVRQGLVVNLNVIPVPVAVGTSTRLDFFVNEKPDSVPVLSSALEIDHERLMHVIGVRNDLEEFFHIHPQPTEAPGFFSIEHLFGKPGLYKVWSEIRRGGQNHIFGHPEFVVAGEGERSRKEVFFGRSVVVGTYQVLLHYDEPIAKDRPSDLHFEIHDARGREVEVEPYLAAPIHLTVIKDDWRQFLHTHPTGHAGGDEKPGLVLLPVARANGVHEETGGEAHGIPFRVTFPEVGTYKLFAQFRPKGIGLPPEEALLASFWIRVEEKVPFAVPGKVTLTGISLVLIALLGLAVARYIRRQPERA